MEEMLAVVARIARRGGSRDRRRGGWVWRRPRRRAAITAGAVGVNLEDGTGDPNWPLADPEVQAAKIWAMREAAAAADIPLVINARTDVYWLGVGAASEPFAAAVERLRSTPADTRRS